MERHRDTLQSLSLFDTMLLIRWRVWISVAVNHLSCNYAGDCVPCESHPCGELNGSSWTAIRN